LTATGADISERPSFSDRSGADPQAALDRLAAGRLPIDCGDLDIHIDRDGSWFYRGSPIKRAALVRLFAGVLHRDAAGTYWLITPAERGRVTVADAPFLGVELACSGDGPDQALTIRTNVDDIVTVDAAHALRVATDPASGEPRPYVAVRNGLEARLARPVFYELVELGREERVGDTTLFGVWSKGTFFPLGRLDAS
jgi:uncharacterized protein